MPPRLKSTAVVAFMVLALYLVLDGRFDSSFYGNGGEHVIQANLGEDIHGKVIPGEAYDTTNSETPSPIPVADEKPVWEPIPSNPSILKSPDDEEGESIVDAQPAPHQSNNDRPTSTRLSRPHRPAYTKPPKVAGTTPLTPASTKAPLGGEKVIPATVVADAGDGIKLQQQFEKESKDLDKSTGAGFIYGTTLQALNHSGSHEGFKAAALTPTEFWTTYSDKRPYVYNPYPDYNSRSWKQQNRGTYHPCLGLKGEAGDLKVYSGHSQVFQEPLMGSFKVFETDFNLCFERDTRLGPYGFSDGATEGGDADASDSKDLFDWDSVDWGLLQRQCFTKNANRYASAYQQQQVIDYVDGKSKPSQLKNSTGQVKRVDTAQDGEQGEIAEKKEKPAFTASSLKGDVDSIDEEDEEHSTTIEDEQLEASKQAAEDMIEEKSRTAVLIRAFAGQNFTDNDKQNTRALITELGLRSGGEYQIFLLVQVKDQTLRIWEDPQAYVDVVETNIPQEFWNITILWNDAQMKKLYPLIPEKVNNVEQSHWLSVQKFAQDNPEFAFFWNWEFDSRYTGHYYDFFEKVDVFSKAQPRKYLWERNERYFIPGFHGPWAKYMKDVESISGPDSVWGPMPDVISPTGPPKKTMQPSEDRYMWGTGEAADYISFAPIFNPVGSSWKGKDDVWGYDGEATPRRATIGMTSRCSRKLLNTMHSANLKGNHVGSEMAPQTVSLLNGLKAVYAPIPMFFDKPWSGKSLQKYFNPGPKGVSGSTKDTPFGSGQESRLQGSTWSSNADPPMRLYKNWLGYEDHKIGGAEWERVNGRVCLPPVLLRPIKNVIYYGSGNSSKAELPS